MFDRSVRVSSTSVEVFEGDLLVMKSSSGVTSVVEVLQADKENGITNVANVIVSHK